MFNGEKIEELESKIRDLEKRLNQSKERTKKDIETLEIEVGIKEEEKEVSHSPYIFYMPWSIYGTKSKLYKRIDELEKKLDWLVDYLKVEEYTQEKKQGFRIKKKTTKKVGN